MIQPSKQCFDLIKKYEGYSAVAYLCPAAVMTIGWGSTRYENGKKVKKGDKITEERAQELLEHEVSKITDALNKMSISLNPNQADAIISFCFNVGVSAFRYSTMFNLIRNNPNDTLIPNQFDRWVYGGGKKLPGLVKRRAEEKKMYSKKLL